MVTSLNDREIVRGIARVVLLAALALGCEGLDPAGRGSASDADATDAPGSDELLFACPKGQFVCTTPKGTKGPCSDHKSDAANCGKCGRVCSKTQKCTNGKCVTPNPCPAGQFTCTDPKGAKGPCSDHKSDAANCGTCGNVCSKTQKCINGACVTPNPCPPGQFICTDPKGAKGPCSDHQSDAVNCGACGNVCSKTQKCINGACVTPNPCPPGQFICQTKEGVSGPCSDHKTDVANCGSCGNVCSKTQKCINGACVTPNPCPPGQFICQTRDGSAGPCSDHLADMVNCGSCGNVCAKTQACRNGSCQ
jgi:hypothetical protein